MDGTLYIHPAGPIDLSGQIDGRFSGQSRQVESPSQCEEEEEGQGQGQEREMTMAWWVEDDGGEDVEGYCRALMSV